INRLYPILLGALLIASADSCNSNDDLGSQDISIPGVTFDGDIDCCSAEEALQVFRFLETVNIIPDLSTVVDGKYNVFAYSRTGKFNVGYNDIYFVATKKKNGNYVKNFEVTGLTPHMLMVKMGMKHSTPVSGPAESFSDSYPAVKRAWVSFIMSSGESGSWTIGYNLDVLGSKGGIEEADITVDPLPAGQDWVKSFKVGNDTYYISVVNPLDFKTGANTIKAYISKKSSPATTPYALATESFKVDIDPRMPDMGNHTSPDNTELIKQADGSYQGTVNLTMTGLWRIHLTVRDLQGNVVAGGDNLSDGFSSLYWDVTI
ncbi:MAG: FixH family protein, partial [Bacteroidaceae bacterium]|nr:FixH family protein [Bacteroidaceae bacterium]